MTTHKAWSVTTNSAMLGGNLRAIGTAKTADVYFDYGTTTSYGSTCGQAVKDVIGEFSASVTGLRPGTTYHYRAKADSGTHGTADGNDSVFITATSPPTVSTAQTTPAGGPHSYRVGTVVNITATPSAGWQFVNWTGDVISPNSVTTVVIINSNKTIIANFAPAAVTTISAIKQNPTSYEGQIVRLSGEYRGWEAGHGSPPVTRSDWVIKDSTGSIYVTGGSLGLSYPQDLGKPITLSGVVRLKNGQPYIEIARR